MKKVAAIIGGGVIGAGWLARFLLNGWDVKVFDPDPEAERKLCVELGEKQIQRSDLCPLAAPWPAAAPEGSSRPPRPTLGTAPPGLRGQGCPRRC